MTRLRKNLLASALTLIGVALGLLAVWIFDETYALAAVLMIEALVIRWTPLVPWIVRRLR